MLLNKVITVLRIQGIDFLEEEAKDLIEACKKDMKISGINENKIKEDDPLIIRAITVYCKAHFGWDNQESEKYQDVYDGMIIKMASSQEYNSEV